MRKTARTVATALLCLGVATGTGSAPAQQGLPFIAPEMLDETRSLDNDRIRFCLNMTSVLVELDRAVGLAIANALLLKPEFYEVRMPVVPSTDFRVPLTETELFVAITNHCDLFLGFRISPSSIPDWLTVSRPYFETGLVFLSTNEAFRSFGDLPAGEPVGVRLGGTGHREFLGYLQTLPRDRRPGSVPYPTNDLLVERLRDGSLSTAFIWALAPFFATDGDVDSIGIKSEFSAPFGVAPLQFSAGMLKQDTFLRGLVDSAIEELLANGTLDQLIADIIPAPGTPG